MNHKASLIVLVAFIALTNAFSFTGNFSSKAITDNQWTHQATSFGTVDLIISKVMGFVQSNADVSSTGGTADVSFGSAYVNTRDRVYATFAYFNGGFNIDTGNFGGFANADIDGSAGFMGYVFLSLDEHAPDSSLVVSHPLEWSRDYFSFTISSSNKDSSKGPLYVTYTATHQADGSNLVIDFSFLVSENAGIVDNNINLVPKSMESVVRIRDYPYSNTNNHLRLRIGVGSVGLTIAASSREASSKGGMYFSLSGNAEVEGKPVDVDVAPFVSTNANTEISGSAFGIQLNSKFGVTADFRVASVSFPAGAKDITYDPSLGNGVSAMDHKGSSSIVSPSFISFFFCIILAAFIL